MKCIVCLCLIASEISAQHCAPTPEAAAQAVIGSAMPVSAVGYRVVDVQVDAVMRRVWLRVVRCSDESSPAVLVPVTAPLHSVSFPAESAQPAVPNSKALLIHVGDTVQAMFKTSTVHMTLDATANQSGGLDETISLTLKHREGQPPDEPDHRIRGVVRADRTVEVQP